MVLFSGSLRGAVRQWFAVLCTLTVVASTGGVRAGSLHSVDLYLSQSPPLSTLEVGGVFGMVGEVTAKAAAMAGYQLQVKTPPWARAQRTVQTGVDQLIIPLSRTPDREDQYTWIAPILTMDRAFFSLDKRVASFDEARITFARIAVGMGSAQEVKLREQGFGTEQIYPLKIGESPAQLLRMGRVDAWFNGVPESRYIWRQVSATPLQEGPSLMRSDLYLACSKRCDPAMVQKLRQAVEALRANGTIERIAHKYDAPPALP